MKHFFYTFFLLFFLTFFQDTFALGITLHSTTTGGDWENGDTWIEGRVPLPIDSTEINGIVHVGRNINTNSIVVNSGGSLISDSNAPSSSFNINIQGNLVNFGEIGGIADSSESNFGMRVLGNISNNGHIFQLLYGVTSFGNLSNAPDAIWKGAVILTGASREREIQLEGKYIPNFEFQSDVTIKGDFQYFGVINLKGYSLFLDGKKEIYIGGVSENGKILSINGSGDQEHLSIGEISGSAGNKGLVTNIEYLKVDSILSNLEKGRQVILGSGALLRNFNTLENLILDSEISINGSVTIVGDIHITSSGKLESYYQFLGNSSFLTIQGNLINDGEIGTEKEQYRNFFGITITGDITNNGTIDSPLLGVISSSNIYNSTDAIWRGGLFLTGENRERNIQISQGFIPNIELKNNIKITGNFRHHGGINLKGKNLYLDPNKDIYVEYISGNGKILTFQNSLPESILEVGTIDGTSLQEGVSTNFGVVKVHTALTGLQSAKIVELGSGSILFGKNNAENFILDGTISLKTSTELHGDVHILENSRLIQSQSGGFWNTLTVIGNLVNDGEIGSQENTYNENLFGVVSFGKLINNGLIYPVTFGITSYGDINNGESASWHGGLLLAGEKIKHLDVLGDFTPSIELLNDMKIDGDLILTSWLNLKGHTLFVNENKTISLGKFTPYSSTKILSLYGNGDGGKIMLGEEGMPEKGTKLEINIENVEIHGQNYGVQARNVFTMSGATLEGEYSLQSLEIQETTFLSHKTHIQGNLVIDEGAVFKRKVGVQGFAFPLEIEGNLTNNGTISSLDAFHYENLFYIFLTGNLSNAGTIYPLRDALFIHRGDIENQGVISSKVLLNWDSIGDNTDYIFSLTGEPDREVSGYTYEVSQQTLSTPKNKWYVLGKINQNSSKKEIWCINFVRCRESIQEEEALTNTGTISQTGSIDSQKDSSQTGSIDPQKDSSQTGSSVETSSGVTQTGSVEEKKPDIQTSTGSIEILPGTQTGTNISTPEGDTPPQIPGSVTNVPEEESTSNLGNESTNSGAQEKLNEMGNASIPQVGEYLKKEISKQNFTVGNGKWFYCPKVHSITDIHAEIVTKNLSKIIKLSWKNPLHEKTKIVRISPKSEEISIDREKYEESMVGNDNYIYFIVTSSSCNPGIFSEMIILKNTFGTNMISSSSPGGEILKNKQAFEGVYGEKYSEKFLFFNAPALSLIFSPQENINYGKLSILLFQKFGDIELEDGTIAFNILKDLGYLQNDFTSEQGVQKQDFDTLITYIQKHQASFSQEVSDALSKVGLSTHFIGTQILEAHFLTQDLKVLANSKPQTYENLKRCFTGEGCNNIQDFIEEKKKLKVQIDAIHLQDFGLDENKRIQTLEDYIELYYTILISIGDDPISKNKETYGKLIPILKKYVLKETSQRSKKLEYSDFKNLYKKSLGNEEIEKQLQFLAKNYLSDIIETNQSETRGELFKSYILNMPF